MGCLLGCFGLEKKKKRRKPANKYLSLEQNHGSYVPLDSEVTTAKLKLAENNNIDLDAVELSKGKLKNPTKVKKKVSFNLNVQAYEPIPCDHDYSSEDEKTSLDYEEGSIGSNIGNYRYQNCREDEEDQFINDEYELSFENDEEDDFYGSEGENETWRQDINSGAGGKMGNSDSVLCPVENLAQWKQVKARKAATLPPTTHYQKENQDLNMDLESHIKKVEDRGISVDASLSNWIL